QIIHGSGTSPSLLKEAGIEGADMVLAVTPNDEVNMVVCALAAQFDVKQRIARLRSQEFDAAGEQVDLSKIGITSVIHPEKVMVDQILQYIESPHAVESANFSGGRVYLRGYRVRDNMELTGKTLIEIRQQIAPAVVLFAAIVRRGVGMIPDGKTKIEPNDIVYALFPEETHDLFLKLVGIERKKSRKLIMTGSSYATVQLARALDGTDHKVTYVDPDIRHAKKIAGMFDKLEVINGDATNEDLLRELNVNAASFFIAVSDWSDYNILSTLLAKAEGAHEVIATSTETRHDRLFNNIGIDHVINPRLIAVRAIFDIISRGHIGAAVELSHIDIEVVRFIVEEESEIAGLKIKRIAKKLKKAAVIGVIVRGDQMILPDGETAIEATDQVIVITHHKNLPDITKLFKTRGLFNRS
ncbi:MAG: Trk system potassium transporter TrkA, partial [candidate division Zixibacteria bacterium]|nr:Trk system potassium transporter TrkA [candidate division Zixibacteria bacterium]